MGGVWSGRRRTFKKAVVERCRAIDTADLKRLNLLVPGTTDRAGTLTWQEDGQPESSTIRYTLTVGDTAGTLRLHYHFKNRGETFNYPVRLVTTGCNLGGLRWWFTCPLSTDGVRCGRRVRKVYLSGNYFGCRHCHRLTYTCTQESDSRMYAACRGGYNPTQFEDMSGWSVSQLGFALRVLTFQQKRLERLGRRLDGNPGRGTSVGILTTAD